MEPRNQFRQAGNRFLGSLQSLQVRALANSLVWLIKVRQQNFFIMMTILLFLIFYDESLTLQRRHNIVLSVSLDYGRSSRHRLLWVEVVNLLTPVTLFKDPISFKVWRLHSSSYATPSVGQR